ncbi:aminotransferase class V-fold PLP-dependent enzyme [Chryseobacterium sp. POL2]|uniref:threonine aldolase family protein n=1 Tax=Chryseobacterium sp. POL2 TaxID=2713414 RepID=UPI0013E154EB|nr:aminotransferase class I/II-fold pyridoxal phosphate-dependent enzyme [Chryseobacterium sp. POL2]QIG88938.1 aminotransferase class V-fold PLP-dependent enzyme [Chryseobacterium sp. POL2]
MKYSFKNDYTEACHPRILQALIETNETQQLGYGQDEYCQQATKLFQEKIKNENAGVYFVSGGTQANLLVISSLLKPFESVISADFGHIQTNETGAIEAVGHKINLIQTKDGKITPSDIQVVLDKHPNIPHQVRPKLVYISNTTEIGTHYSKTELEKLYQFCQSKNLYLFIDGARMSQAIAIPEAELSLEIIAKNSDVFYFGGTKNGALIGEAIIFNNEKLSEDFPFVIKQKGAMLAKGRLLGIQFLELLKDDLYLELGKHANRQTQKIKSAFEKKNVSFLTNSLSNQIFPILKNDHIKILQHEFDFYIWQQIDAEHSAIRLICSWATTDEVVGQLITNIENL